VPLKVIGRLKDAPMGPEKVRSNIGILLVKERRRTSRSDWNHVKSEAKEKVTISAGNST
jgi:hypothetical protein